MSAALKRAHDLDIVARMERRLWPFGAVYHGAVDGDGDKACLGVDAAQGEQLGDRRRRHLRLDAVDAQPGHKAPWAMVSTLAGPNRSGADRSGAKRSGENGRAVSGSVPLS